MRSKQHSVGFNIIPYNREMLLLKSMGLFSWKPLQKQLLMWKM